MSQDETTPPPKKMSGGYSAWESGAKVFGSAGQQHAVGGNDNTIAMKATCGGKKKGKKGGDVGTTLAVPLVLTGVQRWYKRRTTKKGGKRGTKKTKSGAKKRISKKR